MNDKLYFTASTDSWNEGVWEFDPAANDGAGAIVLVADLADVHDAVYMSYLTPIDDKLYFFTQQWTDVQSSIDLWQYDPSANDDGGESSFVVTVIEETDSFEEIYVEEALALDGRLYFSIDDPYSWDENFE